MLRIAIKMLLGDKPKYLALVFGTTFATLLLTQQVSIFIGLMGRVAGTIHQVAEADIWVMDPRMRYIEEVEPLRDIELSRVRSVPGVQWAVPFFKGAAPIRTPSGLIQQVQVIGTDATSLTGVAREQVLGHPEAIRKPRTAMIDLSGYRYTWPGEPLVLGKTIELNDCRIVIDAICQAKPTFYTFPILFVTYDTAREIMPAQRKMLSFVLVRAQPGLDPQVLCQRIQQRTGLQALTSDAFAQKSIQYILKRTAIPINFGITVALSILVGGAITAQTFYIFVVENIRQFGAMKAIGVTNRQLLGMVMTQAAIIAWVGYTLGMGLIGLFFKFTSQSAAFRGFRLHGEVMLGAAGVIALIVTLSVLASLRRVFKLDPALVFRA
jgi:putative ABC transport system permease protein